MNEVNNILNLDWRGFIYVVFLIMVSLIAIHKVCVEFASLVKKLYYKVKGLDPNPKNKEQDAEIEKVKAKQEEFENALALIKENMMIATWDRIVHFGLNYIRDGHISYAEKDIFMSQAKSYKKCGGNGHLVKFVPMVEALPFTEDLTEDARIEIENDEKARQRRVALAEASLSSYYSGDFYETPK